MQLLASLKPESITQVKILKIVGNVDSILGHLVALCATTLTHYAIRLFENMKPHSYQKIKFALNQS